MVEGQEKKINWNVLGSILLGVVSIIGIFLGGSGSYLSIIGLFLGLISLREINKSRLNIRWFVWLGIILNGIGLGTLSF